MAVDAKLLVSAAVALVLGLALGGLAPRSEVRALEAKVAELEDRPCRGSAGRDLAAVFRGRPWEEGLPAEPAPSEVPEPVEAPDEPPRDGPVRIEIGDGPEAPANPEEAFAAAKEAMLIRQDLARAAFMEDVQPDDAQLATFESAVDDMNAELRALAEGMVDTVLDGEEPTRRQTLEFAADSLDVLLRTEDRIQDSLTDEQLGAMQEQSSDPLSYVDPGLLDVFMELEQ